MNTYIKTLFRYCLITFGACSFLAVTALVGAYFYVAGSLPRVEKLSDYRPPVVTEVFSSDDEVIAEYSNERRIVVPVESMPESLLQAFIAAEDSSFYEHEGIDFASIMRAAWKNFKAGGIVQGGSTITQQVAKSLLLTPERSYSRKFKEAILARRMEKHLTKKEILHLYLNQIYLGHGAYGVQAAAENYFAKDVEELTIAESAILAGLPRAPSRYSPYRHLDRAKQRQQYVLDRMVANDFLTSDEARDAYSEELTIHPRVNSYITDTAYFTEQVRRYLEKRYGEKMLYTGGLEVHTTMNLGMQLQAQEAVRNNLKEHDRRQGYRGPEEVLEDREAIGTFLEEQAEGLNEVVPEPGTTLKAVLTAHRPATENRPLTLQVRFGHLTGHIFIDDDHWAQPLRVVESPDAVAKDSGKTTFLPYGSVLSVTIEGLSDDGNLKLALDQEPLAESALIALDPDTGRIKAMVGGYDFNRSQFNRAIQARRLPGSAFKPLIYSAALDKGFTPASIVYDTPIIYKEKDQTGEDVAWKPKNYSKKWYGPTTVRSGLARSRNIITIKILEEIGINYAANYAQKLGIESDITRDLTLALGSTALTPLELATAYTVFANGGVRVSPTYITKVVDRDGRILESIDPSDFPQGLEPDQRLIQQTRERVISPETAYLTTNILESVVRNGTGWRAKKLGRPVAGKTGTTNDLKDAWFAGYVPQLVSVSWVGYDQERPLGRNETGSLAAAPAWVSFMREAVKDYKPIDFPVPETMVFRPIDPKTGLLVPADSENGYVEVFAPGTEPTDYAMEEDKLEAQDFFKMDF
ncbi:MAG: penicillin-binding protein 1A [Desulfuromonadales bacterium]